MVKKAKKNSGCGAPDGFPEKDWNKLSEVWRDAALTKQTEELEREIIKSVKIMAGISFDMKQDDKLKALQDELKELKGAYTESIGIEKAKVDYCVYLFNTRGMPLSPDTMKAANKAKKDAAEDED